MTPALVLELLQRLSFTGPGCLCRTWVTWFTIIHNTYPFGMGRITTNMRMRNLRISKQVLAFLESAAMWCDCVGHISDDETCLLGEVDLLGTCAGDGHFITDTMPVYCLSKHPGATAGWK
ncbi:hypothetical protein AVEN_94156-1 [Araneus ventricosus]|uniref:Uncharacterized protein n=1 Tax=Araneus ventricosus TaxID=182803 RepID=A0A4Y2IG07_ARAVE|nr:hypothetical protein AVEN_90809-1 [Araneus ventricosus]GBM76598.1 hypothetical protein AVEN_94156-1 [Araneus ventricosus]